jgi:diacylglycerol kinase family enzyme
MGNGNYFGGGMRIAPNAVVDDGLIDIVGVTNMAKIRLLYHFPKIYKGEHLKIDTVCHHVSERISVSSDRDVIIQMDGEVVGELPMEISVHKKALCILSA